MAYYYDLGIDCGFSEEIADRLAQHFDGLSVALPGLPEVKFEVHGKTSRWDHWFVGVWPIGMGYAVLDCRPELMDLKNYAIIRDFLFTQLSLVSGYRLARFGCEVFEFFNDSTPEELWDVDYIDLVYREREFPAVPPHVRVTPFSPGYVEVMEIGSGIVV